MNGRLRCFAGLLAGSLLAGTLPGQAEVSIRSYDVAFRSRFESAATFLDHGQFSHSILQATLALGMHPIPHDAALVYEVRGEAQLGLDHKAEALADLNAAVQNDPSLPQLFRRRGSLHERMGDWAAAASDYTESLKRKDPDSRDLYLPRGDVYMELGQFDLARRDYEAAVANPVRSAHDYASRAKAFDRLGQYDRAAQDIATAKGKHPRDSHTLNALAWLEATSPSARLRNGSNAMQDATLACQRAKWKDPDVLDTLAAAEAEAGDFPAAVGHQKQAITLETEPPKRKELQQHLALLKKRQPVRDDSAVRRNSS